MGFEYGAGDVERVLGRGRPMAVSEELPVSIAEHVTEPLPTPPENLPEDVPMAVAVQQPDYEYRRYAPTIYRSRGNQRRRRAAGVVLLCAGVAASTLVGSKLAGHDLTPGAAGPGPHQSPLPTLSGKPLPTAEPGKHSAGNPSGAPDSSPSPSVNIRDYTLTALPFGSGKSDCQTAGSYRTQPVALPFSERSHHYLVKLPALTFDLKTCASGVLATVRNNGVDAASQTYRKQVLVNQDSLRTEANIEPNKPTIQTLYPADLLEQKGYKDVCSALPKLVGCPGIAIPNSYSLTASEQATALNTALLLATQAITPCETMEYRNERAAIIKGFTAEARRLQIDPSLISVRFVNGHGKPAIKQPSYTDQLVQRLAARGALTDTAGQSGLFGNQIAITTVCRPLPGGKTQ